MRDGPHSIEREGDLVQRIQDRYDSLRKSERLVADYLRAHAGNRMDYSITELAEVLGLSEATISRVSRALGYAGFSDLKLSMAEGAASRSGFSNIPPELDRGGLLRGHERQALEPPRPEHPGHAAHARPEGRRALRAAIAAARRVVFIGVGGAASICDEAAHLFIKAGIDAISYNDTYTQLIAAANVTPKCVTIGVSHTGTTLGVADALTLARDHGATTIAITSDPASAVAAAAATVLVTWNATVPSVPLYGDFLEGRIGQLYLIDLLYIGVLFENHSERANRLQVTAGALERYYLFGSDRGRS